MVDQVAHRGGVGGGERTDHVVVDGGDHGAVEDAQDREELGGHHALERAGALAGGGVEGAAGALGEQRPRLLGRGVGGHDQARGRQQQLGGQAPGAGLGGHGDAGGGGEALVEQVTQLRVGLQHRLRQAADARRAVVDDQPALVLVARQVQALAGGVGAAEQGEQHALAGGVDGDAGAAAGGDEGERVERAVHGPSLSGRAARPDPHPHDVAPRTAGGRLPFLGCGLVGGCRAAHGGWPGVARGIVQQLICHSSLPPLI